MSELKPKRVYGELLYFDIVIRHKSFVLVLSWESVVVDKYKDSGCGTSLCLLVQFIPLCKGSWSCNQGKI